MPETKESYFGVPGGGDRHQRGSSPPNQALKARLHCASLLGVRADRPLHHTQAVAGHSQPASSLVPTCLHIHIPPLRRP